MKKFISAVFVTFFVCFIADGQTQDKNSGKTSKVEQQIRALNRAWADANAKGDAAALDRLFADDLIVTSGSGGYRNKAEEIKDAALSTDPSFAWVIPFTTEDVRVKVYKDAAVVAGLAKWSFKFKDKQYNQERRYTHTYVKQKGRWQIASQQVSSNLYKELQTAP